MAYPISDVPRRIVYSGSAGVGPYAFTFEVLTASDIAVYKNQTLLTLTTDYTVSINTGTGTGTVTLVVAATGSDTVTLVGDRAIQRTSDFVTGGDLFANTLNAELDAQTIYAQQIDEKAERAIRAPVTDPTTINMVLPPQATRASKALGFSSNGNPTQSASTLAAIDAAVTTIQTIAAASPGSSAGISHIAAGSGAVATTVQAKLRETVSVKDFGAVGDYNPSTGVGTDDTLSIQSAFNFAMSLGKRVFFPAGFYRTTDTISLLNANWVRSFGFFGESANSTRIYFDNAVSLKNMFFVDTNVNYLEVSDLEFLDRTSRTSRCFYFRDITPDPAGALPSWKHLFRNFRIFAFKEGVRFDGDASDVTKDAHCSEVMFLHGKVRNCETGLVYNSIQAVNHQLIGLDMENDVEGVSDEWTHIKMERGTTINHLGGSVIGKGPYLSYLYSTPGGFQDTSQFASKGVRVEKRGGTSPLISHDTASTIIVVSNSLRIIIDDMPIVASGGATLFARFGGRTFAKFQNVHANVEMDVEAYITSNLAANGEYGSIRIEDCDRINYKRVSSVSAYGSAGIAASNLRSIPCEITRRNESTVGANDGAGYFTLTNPSQTIYQGGWTTAQLKTLVYANPDTAGLGSGSNPFTAQVKLPLFGRPCKFRLLRDDVNAGSAFVLTLRIVKAGAFGISGCADNGAGLIRVTTAGNHGLATGDGVTIAGVVGTTEANGNWPTITVISATQFDLDGSTFTNAYVSGGTYTSDHTAASITPTSNQAGHFEANIVTVGAIPLANFINDGVNWDGKMKVIKSGTANGYVGLVMIDYM